MYWKSGVVLGGCFLLVGCKVTYNQGFEQGFKDGYCDGKIVCTSPMPFKSSTGYPKPNGTWTFDYNEGYLQGKTNAKSFILKREFEKTMQEIENFKSR